MDKGDKIFWIVIFIGVIAIVYGGITSEVTYETSLIEESEIYSLSLYNDFDIRFVLGSGYGGSYFNYYFYKDWGRGKRLDSVKADVTKIIETDEETPKVRKYETIMYRSFYMTKSPQCYVTYYNELIVPTNTTQRTFLAEV